MDHELYRVACHESGHVLACMEYGIRFSKVVANADGSGGVDTDTTLTPFRHQLILYLCGPVCENTLAPNHDKSGSNSDWRRFDSLLATVADDRQRQLEKG